MRTVSKACFLLSLACLSYFYGFASRTWGWFPGELVNTAGAQAATVLRQLPFLDLPDFTAPKVYERRGPRVVDGGAMQPGLTLVVSSWKGRKEDRWRPGLRLIDRSGRIHHEWRVDPVSLFPDSAKRRGIGLEDFDVHGAYLFPDGDVLVNVEYVGAVRLDACSRVRWTLPEGNHHSIARADDGTFWIPGVTFLTPPVTERHPDGLPGLTASGFHDRILRVSAEGTVLDDINVLDLLYDNGLERYILKARREGSEDVTHLNDVEPLSVSMASEYPLFEPGDLLVSLRHLDLVLVFDPESRRVKWHASDPFLRQHDPDFVGGGWIGVFDNNTDPSARGSVLGGSRVVALRPHTGESRTLFPGPESEPFYTDVRGKWQRLENGNLLLTEAGAGRIVEVTPDGRTVWDWVVEPYDRTRVPFVTQGLRVGLDPERVRSWPCAPPSLDADPTSHSTGGST